jgi:hypothetical protein
MGKIVTTAAHQHRLRGVELRCASWREKLSELDCFDHIPKPNVAQS